MMKVKKLLRAVRFVPLLSVALVLVPEISCAANSVKGKEVYVVHCQSCHGTAGASIMLDIPNFEAGERMLQPDLVLFGAIKGGKNAMPSFQGILNDSEILDVIAYLRTLN